MALKIPMEMGDSTWETDPNEIDSDGDGLTDGSEDSNLNGVRDADETDPRLVDTDMDGRNDSVEIAGNVPTDPLVRDTDGDGLADGTEDHQWRWCCEWERVRPHVGRYRRRWRAGWCRGDPRSEPERPFR